MKVQIINGPNINLLGKREPSIYGAMSFDTYYKHLVALYPDIEFAYFQSNIEGELIDKIQEVGFDYDGIVLNAGAYTHTSIALQDAIRAITDFCPLVFFGYNSCNKADEPASQSTVLCPAG